MRKLTKKKLGYGLPLMALAFILSGCGDQSAAKHEPQQKQAAAVEQTTMNTYEPPSMDKVPEGPLGDSIKLGYKIMNETNTALPHNVGNNLACSSCHGGAGTDTTSPLTGVTAVYPAYNPRAGKVLTIEDRINGCFKRSMNGKPLEANSDEMRAMVAYLNYISTDVPIGMKERPWIIKNSMQNAPKPNVANGEKLYQQSCSACHGADGSGTGPTSGPALWGSKSFNIGAGMGRISTAAGYIQRNMPLGEMGGVKQGTLNDQQAADLAGFILSQQRPDFAEKVNDWPKGDGPADVPYELKSSKK
ncbi:c-type cytochrome [Neobacillus mesonae]|uniref:c-type cytochrome n=1 Tax=Neobacillus mesonae TaxID=1193713 RepID=UPI002E204222|nr:c-type cytochrome [Neobacillus mesonae]MED4205555.1 c-type cytochrome [Neobacillus mesonae]